MAVAFCAEHECPLVMLDDEYVCPCEFLDLHIGGQQVRDIVPEPAMLVFADGHSLELLCPDCEQSLHLTAAALSVLGGLYLVSLGYSPAAPKSLFLGFGDAPPHAEAVAQAEIEISLASVARLACPASADGGEDDADYQGEL